MKFNKTTLTAVALLCFSHNINAAPLPPGTVLSVDSGGMPDSSGRCTVGSCVGMAFSPGFYAWVMVDPGNDGGFIVGKNQQSGGQELAPSISNATPGDITAAWYFFGAFGTFFADNMLNIFSDTSNDGTTVLNDYNIAWNGVVMPLADSEAYGVMNDYTIVLDNAGGGSWSMSYTGYLSVSAPATMVVRGVVNIPEPPCNCPPVVNDVNLKTDPGLQVEWLPDFSDPDPDATHTCHISSNAMYGYATVNPDCSSGSYVPASAYEGTDSFTYTVTDQEGNSGAGTVIVDVCYDCGACVFCTTCMDDNPIRQITTVGGGQSPTVNNTVIATFTGHITTESGLVSGGKNVVKICPGTTVDFTSDSSEGITTCAINGAVTASTGTLALGDKLICSNKPDGSDVDRFSIKSGL